MPNQFLKRAFLIVMLFSARAAYSQSSCNGSLGDPIINISFGQGINPGAPLSASVPGASTSYSYVAPAGDPPANIILDGNYSLVNNTPSNPGWLSARDHTNSTNGYMAFFNAAPTPGEFYRQTVSGLCPGTTYEFAAWVLNAINSNVIPNAVPPNVTFKIYNPSDLTVPLAVFSTGNIAAANTPIWHRFSTLFSTPAGITSLILTLSNNNVGGTNNVGNDLAIDDITFRACGPLTTASFSAAVPDLTQTVCKGTDVNLYGTISSGLSNPVYQWQISNDNGNNFSDITASANINTVVAGLNAGAYKIRLLSAETGNINSSTCRFVSNILNLTVLDCNSISCSNWLKTPSFTSAVNIGDLDITGNQITVEALANRISFFSNGILTDGDLVSKHTGPTNINYLLRPTRALITTSTGFYMTPEVCDIVLNKTYHYAMVYNGSSLKFYRNGFLMSEVAASGNLAQNNLQAAIGLLSAQNLSENFIGYINEVRIWNTARTQAQIRNFMDIPLPNPAGQPGLQAYYTFDNLLNKQGNPLWNGTISGSATINSTNPNCGFTVDSCFLRTPISNVINDYTEVLGYDICKNSLVVTDATKYNPGDTVLLIQMKGAVIDSTNTAAFGTVKDYKNAGNYEYNYVKQKTGNTIELKNLITRTYDIPYGKVQLVRVPYYNTALVTGTLTCLPWDGNKGGILAFNVRDTLIMQNDIDVTGKGFKGGIMHNAMINTYTCGINGFYYPVNTEHAAGKGESIADLSDARNAGKGLKASGGGGGMDTNSGGGGGGNGNTGGRGGDEYIACANHATSNNWGLGGNPLIYNTTVNKIFLAGGGGAGHCNNGFENPAVNTDFNGGSGGGLVIISSNYIQGNNKNIFANGATAYELTAPGFLAHDGMGGGGGGGTVLVNNNVYLSNLNIKVTGGRGGNMSSSTVGGLVGPGGGGAGGVVWMNQSTLPTGITVTNSGGASGVIIQNGNNPYGATAGTAGTNVFSLSLPVDNIPFKANIDSVRFNVATSSCSQFNFAGLGYVNTNPVASWNWNFGDGNTANTQNTSHTYITSGTYTVKLIVTDINGCRDSITKTITTSAFSMDAGADKTFCGSPGTIQLHAATSLATATYLWEPVANFNSSTSPDPILTTDTTIRAYLTVTDPISGCAVKDSLMITVNSVPDVKTIDNATICSGESITLTTTPGFLNYHWSPGVLVSDSAIGSPVFSQQLTQTLIISASNGLCTGKDTVTITVKPSPVLNTIPDIITCNTQTITLTTTGNAATYSWSPQLYLDDPDIASPQFNGPAGNNYIVTGTLNGCIKRDSVLITVKTPGDLLQPPAKSFCKGGSVILNGNNGNLVNYTWSPSGHLSNTGISNPVADPEVTTLYSVHIADPYCNIQNDFAVLVSVLPSPEIHASKANDVNCLVMSSNLYATGAKDYVWSPAGTVSSVVIANPFVTPDSTTTYYVTGTNTNGCTGKDSVTVYKDNGDGMVSLPNTFTPNGDGKNDCFRVLINGEIKNFDFVIFNRFGEKVFETHDSNVCWDGNYLGKKALMGNYVYYFVAFTRCGKIVKKGNVLLLR